MLVISLQTLRSDNATSRADRLVIMQLMHEVPGRFRFLDANLKGNRGLAAALCGQVRMRGGVTGLASTQQRVA
jgi:hypothetical protein